MPTKTPRAASALAILAATLLASCAAVPDLGQKPEANAASHYDSKTAFAGPEIQWPADRWWESYGNATLTALIDEALADSPTLAVASARLRQADAAVRQAGAAQLPTVSAQSSLEVLNKDVDIDSFPGVGGVSFNDWSTQATATTKLEYQVDFFGRNRASLAAATSRADAAKADMAAARLQLSTAVAAAYADLLRLSADQQALNDVVRLRGDSAALVHQRRDNGLENDSQSHQSDAELAKARADLIAVDGAIVRARHALAALLGKGPDRGLSIVVADVRLSSAGLPANVGLDLMGRRPDLVAARLRADAAAHRIDVARADFYPNVNLTALVGLQTIGLGQLGKGDVGFVQAGPAISLPIFDGGRVDGAYRSSRAEYDAAVAQYNDAVTIAFREVADAISDRRTLEAQLVQSRAALQSAEQAYRLARLRYDGGLSNYITVLTIENSLVAQRRTVAELESKAFIIDVALVRALGGGFNSTKPTSSAT